MTRPGIDEHDTGSYLDGSLLEHNVQDVLADGTVRADPSPAFRTEAIFSSDALCRTCSYSTAQACGYGHPETMSVAYHGTTGEPEEVLALRAETGHLIAIASYGYGRAYFAPGEPRTTLCSSCGAETLIDTEAS